MTTQVLITGKLHPSAIAAFEQNDALSIVYRPDCSKKELDELVKTAQVLVTRSETDVDRALIDRAPELKVIARAAVGVGNIDLDYATSRGILVINTPGKNTNSAAELTMGLMVGMLRNLPQAHAKVKSGGWDRHRYSGYELRGKVVGIVGLGNVGHRVAKFCRGFDMEVIAYDPYIAPEVFARNGARRIDSLAELMRQADVLTVHTPLNKETKGMITLELLRSMKRGSWVVNAARGGIIAETDLLEVLGDDHIAGVALDVFEKEPDPMKALIEHPRVWVSPHIGASTEEAQLAIGHSIVQEVNKAVDGGVVDYPVNLPSIGVIDQPLLKAYSVLGEKLGAMVGQILGFNPKSIEFLYRGDLAEIDNTLVRLSFMRGYAAKVVEDYVSFVNVTRHFEAMGIKLEEVKEPAFASYKSALKVVVHGANEQKLTVGGVVFDDRYPRISLINDFYFEVEPEGPMILIENLDRPGVVGNVGVFLAQHGVNISSFTLSRNSKGGKAMAVLCTDSELSPDSLRAMQKIENIVTVKSLVL